jgi:hypothetical protein
MSIDEVANVMGVYEYGLSSATCYLIPVWKRKMCSIAKLLDDDLA